MTDIRKLLAEEVTVQDVIDAFTDEKTGEPVARITVYDSDKDKLVYDSDRWENEECGTERMFTFNVYPAIHGRPARVAIML